MRKSTLEKQAKALRVLLRAIRKDAKLTQQQLALLLEKPQSFVAKYEAGERQLDVPELLAICKALGANPAAFIRTLIRVSR